MNGDRPIQSITVENPFLAEIHRVAAVLAVYQRDVVSEAIEISSGESVGHLGIGTKRIGYVVSSDRASIEWPDGTIKMYDAELVRQLGFDLLDYAADLAVDGIQSRRSEEAADNHLAAPEAVALNIAAQVASSTEANARAYLTDLAEQILKLARTL